MWNEVLRGVLAIVIGALLKLLLAAIGVEIDDVLFNTLVAAIVTWIIVQLGLEAAKAMAPRYFK